MSAPNNMAKEQNSGAEERNRQKELNANFIKEVRRGNEATALKMLADGRASPFAASPKDGAGLMMCIERGLEALALAMIAASTKEAPMGGEPAEAWTENKNSLGETLLWVAAKKDLPAIAEALMEAGASMRVANTSQCSLLCWSIAHGREDISAAMIERSRLALRRARDHSGNVKLAWVKAKRLSCLDDQNAAGECAALAAFKQGKYELAELLIRAGAEATLEERTWERAAAQAASPSEARERIGRLLRWQSLSREEAHEEVKEYGARIFAAERLSKSLRERGLDAAGMLSKVSGAVASERQERPPEALGRRAATGQRASR